jgi:TPR repeat protein
LPQAKNNNPEAQNYVGEIYEKGVGLKPDYTIAAKWYKKAAAQGNSRSQINLGYLYEKGLGVKQDLVAALNWYRMASGLEDDDLAFASTIETEVKAEYQNELNLLRNQLDSSQSEITRLESKLKNSRNNYHREQKKLSQLRNTLNNTSEQLKKIKHSGNKRSNQNDIKKYEQQLKSDTSKAQQQLKVAEQAKANLNKYNEKLSLKLKQAEQHSAHLSEELIKHKQEEGQLKAKLINLQSQLASSKLSIAQLSDNLLSEQQKIDAEKNELTRLKDQESQQTSLELNQLKSQLAVRNKELKKRHLLITNLEKEKLQLSKEKEALAADKNKTLIEKNSALELFNTKLKLQDENLAKQHLKISQLEAEKKQANIAKQKLEQARNTDSSTNDKRIKQLESQLALREQSFADQRNKIQALEKEKLKYEQKIKKIQVQEKPVYAKPSIEILEPPFTITRSNSIPMVNLRSVMSHREITGRVTAPAGLLSLNVNGIKEDINQSGIFSTLIALKEKDTLVKAVAIDKAGRKAELKFMLHATEYTPNPDTPEEPVNKPKPKNVPPAVDFGPYHALIIGNQNYKQFPNLDSPINDAETIAKILRNNYGFKTTVILDASRYDILSALNNLRSKLTEVDNLLIYYAGHGELDRVNMRGHWLPVDAEANNTANWISTIAITDILNAMSAKHVMVVADSCYSGAMTRSSLARLESGMTEKLRIKWLKLMSKTRSRTVLTSGGLKPVLDSGLNGHSIFANAFIKSISDNSCILEGQKLYRQIFDNLLQVTKRLNFKQEPLYAPIRHGGHEAGDFFLVKRSSKAL